VVKIVTRGWEYICIVVEKLACWKLKHVLNISLSMEKSLPSPGL